jgi:hypothetical protein
MSIEYRVSSIEAAPQGTGFLAPRPSVLGPFFK